MARSMARTWVVMFAILAPVYLALDWLWPALWNSSHIPWWGEVFMAAGVATCWAAVPTLIKLRRLERRKPDYARIAALERELGIGVIEEIEEPEPAPRLPSFRTPIQRGVPFERNGEWFIDVGNWEIGYGRGELGHIRALAAARGLNSL